MELNKLEQSFKLNNFNTEDDVKIHFHKTIVGRTKSYNG